MKLEAKKSSYKLPWIGQLVEVAVEMLELETEPQAMVFRVIIISWERMVAFRAHDDGRGVRHSVGGLSAP